MTAPMTSPNRRAALGALDRVRPLVAGLQRNRPNEELGAELGAAWAATEVVLRALLGGSTLAGQALVREVRQRELLTLEQAHALVNFHAARDRAELPGYEIAAADVAAARAAVDQLSAALDGVTVSPAANAPDVSAYRPASPNAASGQEFAAGGAAVTGAAPRRAIPAGVIVALVALLLIAVPLGAWWLMSNRAGGPRSMETATRLYAQGQRDQARVAFAEIARERPELALPHVYLARIAREQNDVAVAQQELQAAIRLDPDNATAQREMGNLMLATDNPELARRFYKRAVELDPSDRVAQGYRGCALMRLGQVDVGRRFMDRAGPGDWTACTPPPPGQPLPAGAMPGSPAGGM
ncbi:MAG: tetratricopeptide repeat protein [Gemmatimonadaceae bacterium]